MAANKVKAQEFSVVGLHYRATKRLMDEWVEQLPVKVRIKREPENREDKNAIAVYLNDRKVTQNGMKIGYLPRQVAAVFASGLDSGYVKMESARLVDLDSDAGTGTAEVKIRKRIHRG